MEIKFRHFYKLFFNVFVVSQTVITVITFNYVAIIQFRIRFSKDYSASCLFSPNIKYTAHMQIKDYATHQGDARKTANEVKLSVW